MTRHTFPGSRCQLNYPSLMKLAGKLMTGYIPSKEHKLWSVQACLLLRRNTRHVFHHGSQQATGGSQFKRPKGYVWASGSTLKGIPQSKNSLLQQGDHQFNKQRSEIRELFGSQIEGQNALENLRAALRLVEGFGDSAHITLQMAIPETRPTGKLQLDLIGAGLRWSRVQLHSAPIPKLTATKLLRIIERLDVDIRQLCKAIADLQVLPAFATLAMLAQGWHKDPKDPKSKSHGAVWVENWLWNIGTSTLAKPLAMTHGLGRRHYYNSNHENNGSWIEDKPSEEASKKPCLRMFEAKPKTTCLLWDLQNLGTCWRSVSNPSSLTSFGFNLWDFNSWQLMEYDLWHLYRI